MSYEDSLRRAQVYSFLAEAFIYPRDNWTADAPLVAGVVRDLGWPAVELALTAISLSELQTAYRQTFGAAGSLSYETEYGLPHEYRQSQEMADIAGFYHAFGFRQGGAVRERADHVAVELEFMYALALKEAYALAQDRPDQSAICVEAAGKFLQDHLGRWITLFAQSVALNGAAPDAANPVYVTMARFASTFVLADADRLGLNLIRPQRADLQHTPYDPDFSCADCEMAGNRPPGFIRLQEVA